MNLILPPNARLGLVHAIRHADEHDLHHRLTSVCQTISKYGLHIEMLPRENLPPILNYDLVIAVGGDGTMLAAAFRCQNTPLLGVRLVPERSTGFLCAVDWQNFEPYLLSIINQGAAITAEQRMQCVIDDIPLPYPILNDVLISNPCPARATRYTLIGPKGAQRQCSSGLWVATALGSHAAIQSAGASPLPPGDVRFILKVRELCAPNHNHAITTMTFSPEQSPRIEAQDQHCTLFGDGALWQKNLVRGNILRFQAHPAPLLRVSMPSEAS